MVVYLNNRLYCSIMFINIIIYNVYHEAIIYDIFRPVNPFFIIQFKVDIYYSRLIGGGGVQTAMKIQTCKISKKKLKKYPWRNFLWNIKWLIQFGKCNLFLRNATYFLVKFYYLKYFIFSCKCLQVNWIKFWNSKKTIQGTECKNSRKSVLQVMHKST